MSSDCLFSYDEKANIFLRWSVNFVYFPSGKKENKVRLDFSFYSNSAYFDHHPLAVEALFEILTV